MKKLLIKLLVLIFSFCCATAGFAGSDIQSITPELIFQSQKEDPNYQFRAARSFTLDEQDNLYIFDYTDYIIKKYDAKGKYITAFGGKGTEPGKFSHLMGIKVFGKILYAVDSIATSTFKLDGTLIDTIPFPKSGHALGNYPGIAKSKQFVLEQIIAGELKKVLSYRDTKGKEVTRLASYDLLEYFPELKKEEDFFLGDEHADGYVYAMTPEGRIFWAETHRFQIYRFDTGNNKSGKVFSGTYTPVPFPAEQIEKLTRRKEQIRKQMPQLHSYVPKQYQLIYHLAVTPGGDLLVFLKSIEKTGFLLFSADGKPKGEFTVNADFDMLKVIIKLHKDKIYFMVPGRRSVKIYSAKLPM